MIAQTRRERLREATLAEIKEVALKQMAEQGAASLSLRGIATAMGLSAPALYNYFKSRDDLVTTLILDAYLSLGDATNAAVETKPALDYGGRFMAAAVAFREWSLAHREEFSLIYGSPIPGYHAPVEVTTPASVRAIMPFMQALEEAWQAGVIGQPAEYSGLADVTQHHLEEVFNVRGYTMPEELLQFAMGGWAMLQGLLTLEIFGHFHYISPDMTPLFQAEMTAYLKRLNLAPN